jgi:hypothetical protein
MRQGWGGKSLRQGQAQGILVAALGVLAAHFGYVAPTGMSWAAISGAQRDDAANGPSAVPRLGA